MIRIKRCAAALCLAILAAPAASQAPWATIRLPQDQAKWWWDDAWWEQGQMPAPANHEVDELQVPVLVFFGEHEQCQRTRPILAGIEALQKRKRDARVIVYPGVGRGFDFRPLEVRTFADDLAAQDSLRRTASFIRAQLA